MGTKNNPGRYDCVARAEPDEPMFTILGRDPLGAEHVLLWCMLRNKDDHGARRLLEKMIDRANAVPYRPNQGDKLVEAVNVSDEMKQWRTGISIAKG